MNMNEDYISNQIAVYKNSKTLLEFQDKLKVAPITSYAHIHASGETGADGRRIHSLIGILMKDYSKGTGDKAVTVCANISPAGGKVYFKPPDCRISGIHLPAGKDIRGQR